MRRRPCERGRATEQAKCKAQRYQPVTDVHASSSSGSFILLRLSLPNQQQLYSQGSKTSLYRRQSWCCELNLAGSSFGHALPACVLEGRSWRSTATVLRILATILNESVVTGMFVLPRPVLVKLRRTESEHMFSAYPRTRTLLVTVGMSQTCRQYPT